MRDMGRRAAYEFERARQAALVQAALRGDEHAREELGALAEE